MHRCDIKRHEIGISPGDHSGGLTWPSQHHAVGPASKFAVRSHNEVISGEIWHFALWITAHKTDHEVIALHLK